jgi:glycerol-3-phosphate dehydrogenase
MVGMMAANARAQKLALLTTTDWDLVVIGGGISGAGVACLAARQGWKVLLIEQRDFAWGASSRSSKLVHGGLRYLKEGDIKTTFHSVREREHLMREAPGLIEPQSFLFADCQGRPPGRWLFQLGLAMYDRMAGQRSRGWVKPADVTWLAPGLAPAHLRGAMVYQDAKTDDARLVWRVLSEAQTAGAVCINYLAAESVLMHQGQVTGLELRDMVSDVSLKVATCSMVNATGAWSDKLRGQVGGKPMLRPLRGSHLLVPWWRLPVAQSISLMHPSDGRPVFFYPWEGTTLIGTTDLDHHSSLDVEASITPEEVDYLLQAVNEQFPAAKLGLHDIMSCYAGVRPVVADGNGNASKTPREHVVVDEHGMVTLTGGKLTTFRLMAQDALKLAARHSGQAFVRRDDPVFSPAAPLDPRWPAAVQHRLGARYGHLTQFLTDNAQPADLESIAGTSTLWIELAIAAQHEAVVHLDDLLLRRTRLGLLLPRGAMGLMPDIQRVCAPCLDWTAQRWEEEIERYRQLIAAHYQLPKSTV